MRASRRFERSVTGICAQVVAGFCMETGICDSTCRRLCFSYDCRLGADFKTGVICMCMCTSHSL